jgi:predicted DNA-binding protein (UPF0251 family)/predicted Fe-Mo cluster-binding NifX family protein
MVRPTKCRLVSALPGVTYFKPAGIPLRFLREIRLSVEEAEALKLKDWEGLEQAAGAARMGVSRPTFQRILTIARRKVAEALLTGKAIRIEGGSFQVAETVLSVYSQKQQNKFSGEKMKFAIPVNQGKLSSHFGQANEFMLLEADDHGQITHKETIRVTPHSCGSLPSELAQCGVQVVLAGGMGMGPRMAFQANHIEVVLGVAEANPEKAVAGYVNQTLTNSPNICDHGDVPCDHSA